MKYFHLFFGAVAGSALLGSSAPAALMIHLPMTEGAGGTTANAGTIGGSAAVESGINWLVGGGPGGTNALDFGTTDDDTTYKSGIEIGPATISNQLDNLPSYTVTMWLKLNSDMSGNTLMHTLIDTQELTGANAPSLWIERNDTRLHLRDTGDRSGANGTFSTNVGTWQFIAFVLEGDDNAGDDATGRYYAGTEVDSASLADTWFNITDGTRTEGDRFKVGGSLDTWTVNSTPGAFADVRFYNEVLDLNTIEGIRLAAIPEPSAVGLLCALGSLLVLRRRR